MRGAWLLFSAGFFCALAMALGAGVAPAAAPHNYRIGKAPKPEFRTAGKSYKIDPQAKSTKAIRSLPPEHFDPIARRERVEHFYRDTLKDRIEDARRERKWHCGPFRREFIYWVASWRPQWRARWAWHHRIYLDELLWNEWMTDHAFAAEVAVLQRNNPPADPDYLPLELAQTSPLLVYADEYINAVCLPQRGPMGTSEAARHSA